MIWEVEYTYEFEAWWNNLLEETQVDIFACVKLLQQHGAHLKFPYSSGIHGSQYAHMRELRIQHKGEPYRIIYTFDPRRHAILLIGGNKTGNNRWYEEYIKKADILYAQHLQELTQEGLIYA